MTGDFPLGIFFKVFDSEMSEQLDMMSEFCYGPDAFQNSGISHSYVRVSLTCGSLISIGFYQIFV